MQGAAAFMRRHAAAPHDDWEGMQDAQFRARVDATLGVLKQILDNERNPELPADVPHTYDDKFGLVEFLSNVTCAPALPSQRARARVRSRLRL